MNEKIPFPKNASFLHTMNRNVDSSNFLIRQYKK